MKKQRLVVKTRWQWLVVLITLVFVGLFYIQKQYFLTADLGRHIKNGEYILETGQIPKNNLYSYTQPDFPALNHHWASGVVYYLIQKGLGFVGLHVVSISVYLSVWVIAIAVAAQKARPMNIVVVMIAVLPFTVWRNEIRPEEFSYLLLMVYLWVLSGVKRQKIKKGWLGLLPILQVAWINLHVFFVLGVGLVGLFWIDELIKWKFRLSKVKLLSGLLVLVTAANLINPFGLAGVLAPMSVDSKNLVNVTETQTVFELLKHFDRMDFVQFVLVIGVSWYGALQLTKKYRFKKYRYEISLVLVFGVLGMWMVRNMAMFGMVLLVVGPEMLEEVANFKLLTVTKKGQLVLVGLIFGVMLLGLLKHDWLYSPFKRGEEFGLGLRAGETKPAEFISEAGIKGPWYNNFDMGGYLIYYFYPEEKVFIDNRPESYSPEFFQGDYIKMHKDENVWVEMLIKHGFNAIIADYKDNTSWLRPFLQRRYYDPMWAWVYQDKNVVMLVRRNQQNEEIIKKYEILNPSQE